ncbi:hypothetical protein ACVWZM_000214 [Bradyrhizobium sp. USDA 4501]
MIEHVDQHLDAEDVGDQDELVALLVRDVAGAAQEFACGEPLGEGQVDLLAEVVHVADQARHDLPVAIRNVLGERGDHVVGDGVLVDVQHGRSSFFLQFPQTCIPVLGNIGCWSHQTNS